MEYMVKPKESEVTVAGVAILCDLECDIAGASLCLFLSNEEVKEIILKKYGDKIGHKLDKIAENERDREGKAKTEGRREP